MDLGLADKAALVVGGSTGIGRATAEILLREGARVTVASRSMDKLREAALSIERATGRGPELATCDAGDPDQVAALMARFGEAPLQDAARTNP